MSLVGEAAVRRVQNYVRFLRYSSREMLAVRLSHFDPNRSLAVRPERSRLHRTSASVHRLSGEASVPIHLHVLDEGATADLFAQLDPVLTGGAEVDAGVDPRVGVLLGSLREAAE